MRFKTIDQLYDELKQIAATECKTGEPVCDCRRCVVFAELNQVYKLIGDIAFNADIPLKLDPAKPVADE